MSKLHLISYAAGSQIHELNRARLVRSARVHGIDEVHVFRPDDIDPEFRDRHASILRQDEGAGYWLWKPYFIQRVLRQSAEGDWVFYVDSGAYIRKSPQQLCRASSDDDIVLFENDYFNRDYVKRDAFVLMNVDESAFHDSRQLDACLLLVRNSERARRFVDDWLGYCSDERIVTDAANTCGLPNLPGFIVHRHDQSVLSLLFWRDRQSLRYKLYPRSLKHRFIVHHRRRTPKVPIWFWHLFHDGIESFIRRTSVHAVLR